LTTCRTNTLEYLLVAVAEGATAYVGLVSPADRKSPLLTPPMPSSPNDPSGREVRSHEEMAFKSGPVCLLVPDKVSACRQQYTSGHVQVRSAAAGGSASREPRVLRQQLELALGLSS
jgi:hypothetical protein